MNDEPISYEKLRAAYMSVECQPDIVRYEITADGVVYLYGSQDQVTGMTTRVGLQHLLDQVKT